MSVHLVRAHDTTDLRGTSWEINGEYVVLAREAGEQTMLSVARARRKEWAEAASALLESLATRDGLLERIEGGEVRSVAVPTAAVPQLIAEAADERFGTADYEALTQADAQRAVLARVVAAGGTLGPEGLDDAIEIEHFPLGYRLHDAIVDLRAAGALEMVAAGGGSLRITVAGEGILHHEALLP